MNPSDIFWNVDVHILIELFLLVVIGYLFLQKSYKPQRALTEKEIDQLCAEWQPDSLHPPLKKWQETCDPPIIKGACTPRCTLEDGREAVNLVSFNYLGMLMEPHVQETVLKGIDKYGCGSCGPRGFYGTIDVHVDLEKRLAQFMGTEEAILYSYGMATVSSTIPAFAKAGDLIICDAGANFAIQTGLVLSRSTFKFFKHNDVADLERVLLQVAAEDKAKKRALNRRFIVIEGIYHNHGDIAPLPEIIALKERFCYRLIVDESHSFGVLGATGRGISEHFGVPTTKLDIITAAMGHSLASVGGFCCSTHVVVDHQRLSGLGYVFSASLPPYTAFASLAALDILEKEPARLKALAANATLVHKGLSKLKGMVLVGDAISPVKHLRLAKPSGNEDTDVVCLQAILKEALGKGVLLAQAKHTPQDTMAPGPSIRVCISSAHTQAELKAACKAIVEVVQGVMSAQ
eukprot:jgi/Mesvir1/11268/Mv01068-RA.1